MASQSSSNSKPISSILSKRRVNQDIDWSLAMLKGDQQQKSIYPYQPVRNAQADMSRYFLKMQSVPFQHVSYTIDWLIEWCFTPLSTVFQSYHGNSSRYSCISWVSLVLGWASRVSCPRTLPRQIHRTQCSWIISQTLIPLNHAGSLSHIRNGDPAWLSWIYDATLYIIT